MKQNFGEGLKAFELARGCSQASMAVTNSMITFCRKMVQAEQELPQVRLAEFYRSIKLSKRSSTFRQFRMVGSNARQLYNHAYHLPCRLSALYECARLKEEVLEELVKAGRIHRFMTDAELKQTIKSYRPSPAGSRLNTG
jgi:hypothetical protein